MESTMGHPMNHHHGGGKHGAGMPPVFAIPFPMAMFGMLTAFMFGANMGAMMGRKMAVMNPAGSEHDAMAWKRKVAAFQAMKGHHHHGDGPACTCRDWHAEKAEPEAEESAVAE
jgi:hypothetical protein